MTTSNFRFLGAEAVVVPAEGQIEGQIDYKI
jgi:hypothetical protein